MSRGKSKRKAKKHQDQRKRGILGTLVDRIKQSFPHREVIIGRPTDGIKMSEVLEKFVEPYMEFATTEEAYRKLLTLALVAWNVALMPEKDRPTRLEELLATLPEDMRETGREIIDDLMVRKERSFSQYRRMIVDFELTDAGDSWRLSVTSTPAPV